jgi:DNA-binding transcriptional LysR family regulator
VAASTLTDGNWHGVELRHLIALRAVAAERSFSAAARSLGYTQSAVSGQILALERLIGARVFVRIRGTRPLELTPAGKVLLVHATAMLERLHAAQVDVGAAQAQPAHLEVGHPRDEEQPVERRFHLEHRRMEVEVVKGMLP